MLNFSIFSSLCISLGAGKGLELRGRISRGRRLCSTALLCSPTNPTHPPTTLSVQAAPEFNSNEMNKHKISCVVIQAISKFNISHKADPWHAQGADCSALNFIIAARFFKISFAILKFRVAKIVKF